MNTGLPEWLPDIIPFSDFNSDLNKYLDHLHSIFKKDFCDLRPVYNEKPVLFDDRNILNYPASFWHLITDQKFENRERVDISNLSLLRCERICWIKPIIDNNAHEKVSVWENIRGRKTNTLFFLEEHDFLVILTNLKNRYYLVSSYYINYQKRKDDLIKEREAYLKMQKPPQRGTA